MKVVNFKQKKPVKPKILAFVLLALVTYIAIFYSEFSLKSIILTTIAMIILSYQEYVVIDDEFNNSRYIKIFGVRLPEQKLKLHFPDYISVFSGKYKQDNDWSTVSSLGTKSQLENITVRLFSKSSHFTVYRSNSYEEALDKANMLGDMLKVKVVDKIKNSST